MKRKQNAPDAAVILVQPNYRIKKDADLWACNPPLGLCYIAAVLEKEHIPVEIIDANTEDLSVSQAVKRITAKHPRYVGFSILTPGADWCMDVAKRLPRTIVRVAGGPHASALPRELVTHGFDIAVMGEGEQTMLEIAKGKDPATIHGIVYRRNRRPVQTPPAAKLNPDTLPLPARHLIVKGGTDRPYFSSGTQYYPWAQLFTSRGCPYNCYFCNKNIFGHAYRPRKPEQVIAEIDHLVHTYHVKEIDIYDDNFNFDMKRAEKILDLIIKRKYTLSLRFSNGIRADKVSAGLLKKMKRAGTDYIAYGVETGDPDILRSIPKGETHDQIKRAVRLTRAAGIEVTGFFIFGLIGDTLETMQKTIDFAVREGFDRAIFNIATPYPGTRMWDLILAKKGKIFIDTWADFHHIANKLAYYLPGMASADDVLRMYRKANYAFYFRPGYILKQLPRALSPGMIPIMFRGLKRILYSQQQSA